MTLNNLLQSKWTSIALWAIIFFALAFAAYNLTQHLYANKERYRANIENFYAKLSSSERQRKETERRHRMLYGETEQKDRLRLITHKLELSGLKMTFPWLTSQIFLGFLVVIAGVAIVVVKWMTNMWLAGIVAGVLALIAVNILLAIACTSATKKVENSMMQFMNLVENFSASSDDLISVIANTVPYTSNPLSRALSECVTEAVNSGDSAAALQALQEKIPSRHFQVLIRNLEISSRYECNYAVVVNDCRDVFHNYIKSEKEKAAIRQGGMVETLTMLGVGGLCLAMVQDISGTGEGLLQLLLTGGIAGNLILGYLCVVVLLALYLGIYKNLKKA